MRPGYLVPAGVVLLALGAIAGAAQFTAPTASGPDHATAAARQVAVTSAARACPPVPGGGPGTVAFIAGPSTASTSGATEPSEGAGQAEGTGQTEGTGEADLTPLPLAGAALRALSPVTAAGPGALSMLTIPAAQSAGKKAATVLQGWSVTASGAMAQALEAEEATGAGLASVRCGEPGSDIWFVGPGQQGGAAQIQLDLMNVDALPASVDVSVITDAGAVQGGGETGITVPPRETVTESLSSTAAGSTVAAIEVRTTIGRVAADVSESSPHGGTASWLPSTTAPSTQLVIPGVPSSGSTAGLYIVVPGSANARVSVVAVTAQGHYHPFGTQTVDLPADSASYVPLTALGGTAALELTANVPVTAAVLVPGSGLGAFTAATAPITEQAVVAGNTIGSGLSAAIVLSAPAGAARVRLTETAATAGASSSQVVTVPGGHTLTVPATLPRGTKHGSAFAIVITPLAGSGPLYAARVETQGQNTVVSIIPAISALTTITLPAVRDSYDAISP
jgi:Family of unknown function (DUF5719)